MPRMRTTKLWGCGVLALVLAAAAQTLGPASAAGEDDFTKRRVVYVVPGMDAVHVESGRYRAGDGTELPFDVYSPPDPTKPARRGAVVLVHGGPGPPGARPHEWGVFQSYGRLVAASGLVAITFTHRLHEAGDYPRAAADVAALVEHVRGRADSLGLDRDRIGVWAFSGGGPLTSFVFRERPSPVRCAVLYYAILDFQEAPKAYAKIPPEMSPVDAVKSAAGSLPPVFIARAGKDEAWILGSIDRFAAAANARGVSLDILTLPDGHHGFDIADDAPRSREVIQSTLDFLARTLAPAESPPPR
jgi:acetyl esterase/lipase